MQFALESSSRVESIDSAQTDDDDRTILDKYDAPDSVTADKELIDEETSAEFKRILSVISPQGQYVIGHFFGIGYEKMTLEKIAERLDMPKEKIQQIKEKNKEQAPEETSGKPLNIQIDGYQALPLCGGALSYIHLSILGLETECLWGAMMVS